MWDCLLSYNCHTPKLVLTKQTCWNRSCSIILYQRLISILWLFILYVFDFIGTPCMHFYLHLCLFGSFILLSFVIMAFFPPLFPFFSYCCPNCPLATTSIPSCTPFLPLFYSALYFFGFLLILLAGCYHFSGSQQGLVARCSLYSRHMNSTAIGLLHRHLPGKVWWGS